MNKIFDSFYTSGWNFPLSEMICRNRYQMINIGILLATVAALYAMIDNFIQMSIFINAAIIVTNIGMIIALRKSKRAFKYVAMLITAQYTFFFLAIVYSGNPTDIKYVWLFTYSTILVYFQSSKKGTYWFIFFISMLLIAPFQKFVHVGYSFYDVSYLSLVLMSIYSVTYFYQVKMEEANALIKEQENKLLLSENILKKELHHRVKNNMQFIISLFKLKLAPFMNPDIQRVIKEVTYKIKGMASVHDMLYKQKIIAGIDASQYFITLVNALRNGYETKHIKFDMKIDAELSSDQLIFCGLIVNEVVMNAIKYAFKDREEEGGWTISLNIYSNEKETVLEIFDNGQGMDASRTTSFGSEMIASLIENELKGKMKLETDKGVKYTFYIPTFPPPRTIGLKE
ncbi:MAG: sensor histidine kinase [Sulfurimonas sp.]|nr:sensor histidine kinase [Sulfurimonas sp.]